MFAADITCPAITCQGRGMTIWETRYNPDETWPGLQSRLSHITAALCAILFFFRLVSTWAGHSRAQSVPWPALGEGLMYQLFGQTRATQDLMTPNPIPLRQIFLACFHNSKMFSLSVAHWHRCLNTRWACLCSSLSQGKFCVVPQTRVLCFPCPTLSQTSTEAKMRISNLYFGLG